ncbi:MAG: hypothetical protein ACO3ID_02820 [Candidatus Nanopelagicales bacterium]
MRRQLAVLLPVSLLATALTAAVAVSSVQAVAGTGVYAGWTRTGTSGTMTLASDGFDSPSATWTTDGASLDVPSGASTWLGPTTPFGAYFGSSQGKPYLNVGTGGTASVTTTYTFAEPTPAGAWGFALGDIDADSVTISATNASGNAVEVATWYQGVFNYCAVSPKPSSCPAGTHDDSPVWNGVDTLTGNGSDTSGAAGWFRPTQAIATLTFTFTKLSGFPIFQTWFAADEPAPTPSPSPTSSSASPSPTDSPTPTPTPTPVPTPTPTPSPTPTPTPVPQRPTAPIDLPEQIAPEGTTVVVDEAIRTNAGQTVRVKVTCKHYSFGRQLIAPRGDYDLCTVRTFAKSGRVTVTTYGRPAKVVVALRAPAIEGYTAYRKNKRYYTD